jgi:V/A-type H+-transporting ATPase subunit D
MAKLIEGAQPTRMDLLKLKKNIKLAVRGHKLLSEKRNTLIAEFFSLIKVVKGVREELSRELESGRIDLVKARGSSKFMEVEAAAAGVEGIGEFEFRMRNLAGVKLPEVGEIEIKERKYDFISTSSKLDEAVAHFNKALADIIKLITHEESLKRIGAEIKKIKRRTNALEYIVIPNLRYTKSFIELRLEELERENFFRLKIIKRKRVK